jgi:2-oxoglutarate ferredoxin oxidoreductase subunit gamma
VRKEIVIAGSGGQGIQSIGSLLAKTLDKKGYPLALSFTYGPEARGGKSYSNIVIKDSPDDWPEILQIDILVALSQEGYDSCLNKLSPNSLVIYDADMVKPELSFGRHYAVPAMQTATFAGSKQMVNMVMLGAMAAITELCSAEEFSASLSEETRPSDRRLEFIRDGYNLCPTYSEV